VAADGQHRRKRTCSVLNPRTYPQDGTVTDEPITGPADVPTTDVDMITIPRVRKFTGGMGACALLTVFATVMVLYTVTADESEWVQAAALLVSATVVVLFLRITGAGGSGRRSPQRRREAGSSGPGH